MGAAHLPAPAQRLPTIELLPQQQRNVTRWPQRAPMLPLRTHCAPTTLLGRRRYIQRCRAATAASVNKYMTIDRSVDDRSRRQAQRCRTVRYANVIFIMAMQHTATSYRSVNYLHQLHAMMIAPPGEFFNCTARSERRTKVDAESLSNCSDHANDDRSPGGKFLPHVYVAS